jgi:GT2 family glycosyltransferase
LPPELSVVIPTHQRTDLLRACLASVSRYAPRGAEVLVVDDASPVGSASAVCRQFPGVCSIRLPRRGGFCVAANAGLRSARGTVVELLNDDTEVTEGWAEAALAWFRDPTVGAVAPLVLQWPGGEIGQARIDSAGDRYYRGGIAAKRGRGELLSSKYLEPCRVFGASASSAFYRREALLRAGFFPESFGAYFEDVDLSFRLHRVGYGVMYEPAARVLHHVSSSHGVPDRRLLEQQSRNEERVFWRNLPACELVAALPAHLAVLAAKSFRRWREGNFIPFLRGRLSLLREIGELLRHRRLLHGDCTDHSMARWQVERKFAA